MITPERAVMLVSAPLVHVLNRGDDPVSIYSVETPEGTSRSK